MMRIFPKHTYGDGPRARCYWGETVSDPGYPQASGQMRCDVAVIGAGFTGLSAALHLAEAGASVVVLEAQQVGWGASGRNGGQINPGLKDAPGKIVEMFGADIGARMVAMSGSAADLVFDLIARHGIECAAIRPGWIRAAHTERSLADLHAL